MNIRANGAGFHVVRTGRGKPLLLLHGWPEFWWTWEPVMTRLFPPAWIDRLGETFSDLDVALFADVGHFPHREAPQEATQAIAAFFERIGWR